MAILLGCDSVHLEFPTKLIAQDVTLGVNEGDRIGIVGKNGDGKSSLLGVLSGEIEPDAGRVTRRRDVTVGVLGQRDALDSASTVHRAVVGDLPEYEWAASPRVRQILDGLIADVPWEGLVGELSGGQRRRVDLARLLIGDYDVLMLDEPTNHLDIYTRESLTQALMAYEGTLLLITHDRYLMNSLECPILYVEDGNATLYPSYERMMHRNDPVAAVPRDEKEKPSAGKAAYGKEQRRRRAELRTRIKAVEEEIETLGAHIVELENEIASPEVLRDHLLLRDKCDELEDSRFHQQELFDEWEKLLEEQEQYEQVE